VTKNEDPTKQSEFHEMSKEDREFLEKVFKSLTIDVVEELNKSVKILMEGNANEEEQITALEVVTNFAADIDSANGKLNIYFKNSMLTDLLFIDFYKIGGFCILIPCLESKYSQVRKETANLIAELAQNNEFCQQKFLDVDILTKLLGMMSDEVEVSTAVFHAISCIVRNYEPAINAFISLGGLECVLGLIQSLENEKLMIKSMFMILSLAQDVKIADQLVKMNAIEKIVETIQAKDQYDVRLEQTLSALDALTQTNEAINRSRDGKLNLRDNLDQVIALGEGKPECEVS
jgi:hsp70-interacting protein